MIRINGIHQDSMCLIEGVHYINVGGKYKYKLIVDVELVLPREFNHMAFPTAYSKYYRVYRYANPPWRIVAGKDYAFDGITAAGFLEDVDNLIMALFHDIFMQAIYDHYRLPKSYLGQAHKIFLIRKPEPTKKDKLIYYSLVLLHKPWNKINGALSWLKKKL